MLSQAATVAWGKAPRVIALTAIACATVALAVVVIVAVGGVWCMCQAWEWVDDD